MTATVSWTTGGFERQFLQGIPDPVITSCGSKMIGARATGCALFCDDLLIADGRLINRINIRAGFSQYKYARAMLQDARPFRHQSAPFLRVFQHG